MSVHGPIRVPEYLRLRERAQRRDWLIQTGAVAGALAAVIGAALLVGPINQIRKDYELIIDPHQIGTLPADISLVTQMGTLRGLAIVVGFGRAEELKQDGRFFELMQLSSWLCKLAPQFDKVWQYNAWNQAYNISVCEYTAEGRWKWVQNGIRLIRDQGLIYNPKSNGLYKELAYIFWHKIGEMTDDHHYDYKRALAVQMERVLGAKPPTLTEEEEIEWFRPVAEADPDVEALIAADPQVAALVQRLGKVGLNPDARLLDFVARYMRPQAEVRRLRKEVDEATQETTNKRLAVLQDERAVDARDRLLASLRARELHAQFRMDPKWMLHLMEKYGPADWRTPFGQTLYWATLGDEVTRGVKKLDPSDAMNTARFIMFAMQNTVQRGRYIIEPDFDEPFNSFINILPDLRFIDHTHETALEIGKQQDADDPEFREGTSGPRYWTGHVNFLRNAIRDLYFEGDVRSMARARYYYEYLRDYDVDQDTGETKPQYIQPLETFVFSIWREAAETSRSATAAIGSLLDRALSQLSLGNADGFEAALARAKWVHKKYSEDPSTDPNERRMLQPFPRMLRDWVAIFMQLPSNSSYMKHRLWEGLDLEVRQDVYDDLLPVFKEICEFEGWDVEKAFRIPPGMEEARQRRPKEREPVRDVDSEGTRDFSQ
ncbi:MAG: hypothetical protein JXB13_15935 [Phycisphaerae bacterium]|nr:hypothetical protein [Phycisphaerae bacterium]